MLFSLYSVVKDYCCHCLAVLWEYNKMWFFSLLLKDIHQTFLLTTTLRSLFSKLSLGVSWPFATLKINMKYFMLLGSVWKIIKTLENSKDYLNRVILIRKCEPTEINVIFSIMAPIRSYFGCLKLAKFTKIRHCIFLF